MSTFTIFFICVQICIIQNVYSQSYCAGGPLSAGYGLNYGAGIPTAAAGIAAPYTLGGLAAAQYGLAPVVEIAAPGPYGIGATAIDIAGAYGGAGVGNVAVAGEIPVAGTTLVAGQVPVLGAVRFAGDLPAAGTVSISGSCGCGCGNAAYY